jgi:hypothetical protein
VVAWVSSNNNINVNDLRREKAEIMDAKELLRLSLPKLRLEATKIPSIAGVKEMKKDDLVQVLAKHHSIVLEKKTTSEEKSEIKARIRALKGKRDEAIAQKDALQVASLRRGIRSLKRRTRVLARALKAAPPAPAAQDGTQAAS